jgi:predicted nucleic acid-binding protein
MKGAVLDASVILKWYLFDETYGQKALDLLHRFITRELNILAPSLLEYELINGLIIAQKRARIKEEKILMAMQGFFDLQIDLRDLSHFFQRSLKYCKIYNRSLYDASYLALAEAEGIPLITADEGLYNAVKQDLKWVKWIGEAVLF